MVCKLGALGLFAQIRVSGTPLTAVGDNQEGRDKGFVICIHNQHQRGLLGIVKFKNCQSDSLPLRTKKGL